jgi:hypothetical protein
MALGCFSGIYLPHVDWRHVKSIKTVQATRLPKGARGEGFVSINGKTEEACQRQKALIILFAYDNIITIDKEVSGAHCMTSSRKQ